MIKPLPGYCLIEPIEDEQKSAGGVYLPESSKDKPMKGKIIATEGTMEKLPNTIDGLQWVKLESPVKVGQIVIYKKWTNQEVDHEGKKYLLVRFDELLGIVE